MADKTVGQVSVRVVPDTSKFRDQAKTKLKAEEARLPELEVELDVVVNARDVVAQVEAARNAAQAAVRDIQIGFNVDGLSAVRNAIEQSLLGGIVSIFLDVDNGSVARSVAALHAVRSEFEAKPWHIRVTADTDFDFDASRIAEIRQTVERELDGIRAKVGVDDSGVRAASGRAREVIKNELSTVEIDVDLDISRTEAQIAALRKNLEEVYKNVRVENDKQQLPIRFTFDASSKQSMAEVWREIDRIAKTLRSTARDPIEIDEILASLPRSEDLPPLIMEIGAEANLRSINEAKKKLLAAWRMQTQEDLIVQARLDFETNRQQIANEMADAREQAMAALHTQAIEANFQYDRQAWHRQVRAARDEALADLRAITANLEIQPDTATLNRSLNELQALITARNGLQARLSVETDGATYAKLEAELAELKNSIRAFTVPIDPEITAASRTRFQAVMAFLTRERNIAIDLNIKRGSIAALSVIGVLSGWTALKDSIVDAHRVFGRLFTEMPKIMQIVPMVLALSGAFLSASANLVSLVGSLAQAIPILLAIPGIAIGIGVTALAFKDFGSVLPGVVEQFKALQPLISSTFWSQAKGPIQDLATNVFGQLKSSLGDTSTALGGFFGSLSSSISSVLGNNVLSDWFAQLSSSIRVFTGFTPVLAGIFKQFGDVGSALLGPLAFYTGELATRFQEWFQGLIDAAGGVDGFAQQTIGAFRGIIEFVLSVGNVFGGLFTAATESGAATFQSLADHLNTFAALLKTPEMQENLVGLFSAAFQMMDLFLNSAGPAFAAVFGTVASLLTDFLPRVGQALGDLSTVIGSIFSNPAVQNGLAQFISGILTGVEAIIPLFLPIGALIAALGPVLGQLASQIGAVFAALAPQIGEVVDSIGPLITLFGGALVSALTAVSPLIQVIIGALNAVLTGLVPLLEPVIAALVTIISSVVPPLMALITALVPPLLAIVGAILPPLASLLTVIGPILAQVIGVVAALLVPLLAAIAPILAQVAGLLGELLIAFMPIISVLAELITALLPPLITIIQLVLAVAMVPLQMMIGALVVAIQVLGAILKWVVEEIIIAYVVPYIQLLVGVIGGVLIPIFELIGTVFAAIWTFVMAIWNAFAKLFSGDVKGFVTDIHQAFMDFRSKIVDAVKGAFDKIVSGVKGAMTQFGDAVNSGVDKVLEFFRGMPARAREAFGDIGDVLNAIGKKLIDGLINGIKAKFQEVKNVLGGLTALLPDWKGPASKDKTLLYDAGQLVIDGFLAGLESRYDAVRKSLRGFTGEIAGTQFSAPQVGVSAGSYNAEGGSSSSGNTLIYNAASGSSLGAEEDLFGAIGRARAFGW